MTALLFNPSSLLLLFLLAHLACSCPIESFSCRNAETPSADCGNHMIRCVNSKPEIQFNGEGKWYRTENIAYPEKSLKILDEQLGSELQHGDCDFLYNFTHPLLTFNTSSIGNLLGSPRLPFFNCTASSYDFSRDLFTEEYDASPCTSYDLYFSHRPGQLQFRNANDCHSSEPPVVKWELLFDETGDDGGVSFSLKSVAFSRSRRPSAECFGCVMKGGGCSSVAAPDSSCICHQDCPRGIRFSHIHIAAMEILTNTCYIYVCV